MNVKATLICEDVRLEVSGAVTLVGVINDRLLAPPGDGALVFNRIVFFIVVAGLRGVERIGFRQYVRRVDAAEPERSTQLDVEQHHPDADEHNFVFGPAQMVLAQPGDYEVVLELQARDESFVHRYRFSVERATTKP